MAIKNHDEVYRYFADLVGKLNSQDEIKILNYMYSIMKLPMNP